jgi:hypothetical protein
VSAKAIGAGTRCMLDDRHWDRFDLDVFCQHCGLYLTTLTGVTRPAMAAASKHLRQEAQAHANEVGRAIDVMYYVTLKHSAVVVPHSAA